MNIQEKDYVNFEKLIRKINQYFNVSLENQEEAKRWLLISKSDMKVCNILINNQYYPEAIYHLEQAFEKLMKCFYIFSGRESTDSVFGHDFVIKVLKKELTEKDDLSLFFQLTNSLENKNYSLKGVPEKIESLSKDEEELRNLSKEEIFALLRIIGKLERKLKSKKSLEKLSKKFQNKKTKNKIKQFLLHIIKGGFRDIPLDEYMGKDSIAKSVDYMIIGMKLHILSLITFPHWNTPRYPKVKNAKTNFFSYNKKIGIVKSTKKLSLEFDKVILVLEKYLLRNQNEKKQQLKTKETKQ